MNDTTKPNDCERAGELVAYFYNEASEAQRESFDAHLALCPACRDELTAFAGVREAVGHWRAEILNAAPAALSLAVATEAQQETNAVSHRTVAAAPQAIATASPRRSALAALREFFTLTPVWLRAATMAAALVVCALAALALVNAEFRWDESGIAFNTRLRGETIAAPPRAGAISERVYTQAELDKLAAERDALQRELEDTRAQLDDSREANLIAAVETLEPVSVEATGTTPNNSRRARRGAAPAPGVRPQQTRRPREERDEDDLPRLYDLLIEAN